MTIRKNEHNNTYALDFNPKGYPRLRRTFKAEVDALILESKLKALVAEGQSPEYVRAFFEAYSNPKDTIAEAPEDALWDKLIEVGRRHYDGTKNWRDGTRQVEEIVELLRIQTPISGLKEKHIDKMVEVWEARQLNPKTINRKLSTLSVLLGKAVRKQWLERRPIIERRKEAEGRLVYFSDEMLDKFFEELKKTSYADMEPVFQFLLDTGCRTGELKKLRLSDINGNKTVTFRGTKSGKMRTVPLTNRLRDYFENNDADVPFPMLTDVRLKKSFDGIKKKLGWSKDYVRHTFRHTCATRLVKGKVHITSVKEWLGHSNINTTMIYIQFDEDHLDDALKALEA